MANTQTRSFIYSLFAVIAILCVSNIAQADLVTYWTFNDYANGTLISATDDSSGNAYKFGHTNPHDSYNLRVNSSTPGVYGNHLQRNSYNKDHDNKSNSNISAANVYSGNMTISFWGTQPSVNWRNYITLRTEATGEELQFQKANNGMVVYKTDRNNGNATSMVGDASLSLGTAWHHFVVTVDSSTQKAYMYIDGNKVSETTWTHNLQVTNITLNGMWNKSGRSSDAKLDELQIYNNSITAQQVQFLYQNPSLYLATEYQRNVTANGNWSDADWNANGQTGQAFANSSAVQLDATNAPTLTVDQNVTVNSIDFNGSMTVDGTNTITLNGEKRITVANAADTATISAPITAQYDNGITKTGAGTLKLTAANTYTGGSTVTGGTLAVTNVNALGSGAVTVNGGTLDASGAGVKNFSNAIVIGSNGGTVTTATADYSSFASISGSGDLTTNGLVHFNGTGAYSGLVTVNSGYTRINPGAFGVFDLTINNSSNFNVFESGTIQIKKLNSTTGSWLFGSKGENTYNFEIGTNTTASDEASYKGYIRGSSASAKNVTVTKVGAGKQTFNTAGKCYGINNVFVNGGTMVIAATGNDYNAETTDGYWGNATITVNSEGTLVYNGNWNTSPNYDLNVNGGTLTINALVYQNKLNLNSATVNGSSQLRVGYVGSGVWNVTGGTSTVNTNIVAARTNSYNTFTINIADGATLDIKKNIVGLTDQATYKGTNLVVNGTGAPGSQGAGTIKFNPAKNVITTDMGTISFNNVKVELAGDASWLQNGYFNGSAVTLTNSTMTTNTNHTTNGTKFTLDGSTLKFNGEVNSYIHQIYLKNGSTISGTTANSQFRTGHQWNSQFFTVYESGKPENVMNTISADIAMFDTSKTTTFNIADKAPLTFSGKFLPASSGHYNGFTKTGAGEMTLTQPLANVGNVAINQGTLTLSAGGTLNNLSGSGVLNYGESAITLNNVANSTFSGDILGSGTVTKTAAGTLTLSKQPGYTGATVVQQGTLALADGGTLYNLSGGSLDGDGNVTAFIVSTDKDLTLSNSELSKFIGSITAATIEKTDDGTMQIYTGANGQVDAQSLVVSSGRMDLKGYMTHNITVDANAVFSPGNSVGEALFGGNYELKEGAILLIEQDASGMDKLTADSYTIDENSVLDLSFSSVQPGATYPIIVQGAYNENDEFVSRDFVDIYSTDDFWNGLLSEEDAYFWNLKVEGDTVYATLDANAVPEPSTWALLALGAAGLLYWRRRK